MGTRPGHGWLGWSVGAFLAAAVAPGAVVTQYSFELNLNDTAPGGGAADTLTAVAASGPLAVNYESGVVGHCVRVGRGAGQATVLAADDSADLDLAASWTIEAFVRPESEHAGEWRRFITKWFDATGEYHWTLRRVAASGSRNSQDLYLNNASVIATASTPPVAEKTWSHVAMTGDSVNGIRLWQNGRVVGTAAYQAVTARTSKFRIGNWRTAAGDAGAQFSGLVDEVLVWNESKDAAYMRARAALLPPFRRPYKNADGTMAHGSYGTIYLDGAGDIWRWDGTRRPPEVVLAGQAATQIAAGTVDLDASADEILFVKNGVPYYYNFASVVSLGGAAPFICAADFENTRVYPAIVANAAGDKFLWTFYGGYTAALNGTGDRGHWLYLGELDPAHDGLEYVSVYVASGGEVNNLRIVSRDAAGAITHAGIGGSGIRDSAVGNILNNGGRNEIILLNTGGDVWIRDIDSGAWSSGGSPGATQLVAGDLDGNGIHEAYFIRASDKLIYRYTYPAGFAALEAHENANWSKLLAADIDGDGKDELVALRAGAYEHVWWLEDGMTRFMSTKTQGTVFVIR